MPRPVTLFTGQWADLPLAELAPLASDMGYDGLELACWGDHFDVDRGDRASRATSAEQRALLERARPAVPRDLDPPRRPGRVRPDRRAAPGDPAAARLGRRRSRGRAPARGRTRSGAPREAARAFGVDVVNGFTGSSDLALDLRVPADEPGLLGRRLPRLRRALDADHGHVREARRALRASRCTRPRSRSTSPRPSARSRRSAAIRSSASTSTRPISATRASTTSQFIRALRRPRSSTPT